MNAKDLIDYQIKALIRLNNFKNKLDSFNLQIQSQIMFYFKLRKIIAIWFNK